MARKQFILLPIDKRGVVGMPIVITKKSKFQSLIEFIGDFILWGACLGIGLWGLYIWVMVNY